MDQVLKAFPLFDETLNKRFIARFEHEAKHTPPIITKCQHCRIEARNCDVISVFELCFHFLCFDCYLCAHAVGPVDCQLCSGFYCATSEAFQSGGTKVQFWLPKGHQAFYRYYNIKRARDPEPGSFVSPVNKISRVTWVPGPDPDEVVHSLEDRPILQREILAMKSYIKFKAPSEFQRLSDRIKKLEEEAEKEKLAKLHAELLLRKLERELFYLSKNLK